VTARRIHLCEVADGRITAVTTYCNGGWDTQLRARHAVEAPMVRP
jgi:ketosteroid isomerase-like protein